MRFFPGFSSKSSNKNDKAVDLRILCNIVRLSKGVVWHFEGVRTGRKVTAPKALQARWVWGHAPPEKQIGSNYTRPLKDEQQQQQQILLKIEK